MRSTSAVGRGLFGARLGLGLHRLLVDVEDAVDLALPVELFLHAALAGLAEARAQLGGCDHAAHRIDQAGHEAAVTCGVDEDTAALVEVVGGSAPARGD